MSVKEKATDLKNKLFKSCKGVTKLWPEQTTEPPETAEPIFFWKRKERNEIKNKKTLTLCESSFSGLRKIALKEEYILIVLDVQL